MELSLCHKLILNSFQPDGANLLYFKLKFYDLKELKSLKYQWIRKSEFVAKTHLLT